MVQRFFRNFRTEIEENLKPAARALIVSEEDGQPIVPENTIPKAIIVEDEEALMSGPDVPAPTPGSTEIPADIPKAVPVVPADDPNNKPPLPTVPGEEVIPNAIPVNPEQPQIPGDTPREAPEIPGNR
jgi:hypothetical protein